MDTVATDVGDDDCFWSDKTINCFKIRLNIDEKLQPRPQVGKVAQNMLDYEM